MSFALTDHGTFKYPRWTVKDISDSIAQNYEVHPFEFWIGRWKRQGVLFTDGFLFDKKYGMKEYAGYSLEEFVNYQDINPADDSRFKGASIYLLDDDEPFLPLINKYKDEFTMDEDDGWAKGMLHVLDHHIDEFIQYVNDGKIYLGDFEFGDYITANV